MSELRDELAALADRWERGNRRPSGAHDQVQAGVWSATKHDVAAIRALLDRFPPEAEGGKRVLHVATIDGNVCHASTVDGNLSDVANGVINHLRGLEGREVQVNVTRRLDGWLRRVEAKHVVTLDGLDFAWVHVFKESDEPWPQQDRRPDEGEDA